jgi:hypothetical protein
MSDWINAILGGAPPAEGERVMRNGCAAVGRPPGPE